MMQTFVASVRKTQMTSKLTKAGARHEPLTFEVEAQQVLDELWQEELIPFALNVGELAKGMGEYTIHFHDSRIRTARVPLTEGSSFRDMVRVAVLARVARISGPLKANPLAHN
jgi:hypothetical protein